MSIYEKIVKETPALKRGKVWCRECGSEQKVDSVHALEHGWPKCCGYTMTIDEPKKKDDEKK